MQYATPCLSLARSSIVWPGRSMREELTMECCQSESSGGCITPVVLEDYRTLARASIPSEVFTYIDSGAGDEITSQANRRDLDGLAVLPLCLRDVSEPKLAVVVLGWSFCLPIWFSRTTFHRHVYADA